MTLTFIEHAGFTEAISAYFGSDDSYAQFQKTLLREPYVWRRDAGLWWATQNPLV